MPVLLDDSRFPLARFTWNEEPTVEDAAGFAADLGRLFARKTPLAIVHDMRGGKQPGIKAINAFADVAKANVENDRRYIAGFAFVVQSAVLRVGLKGFFALAPLAAPSFVTASMEEAETWARERFREKGGLPS